MGGLVVSWHPRPTGWDAYREAASDLNLAERSNSQKGQRTENEFSSLSPTGNRPDSILEFVQLLELPADCIGRRDLN